MSVRRITRRYNPDWIEKALEEAAITVEGQAVENAPVDTGYLRGQIGHEVQKDVAIVGTEGVPYAPHVEYGTKYMSAQPFLRPAFDEKKSDVIDIIQRNWRRRSFG